MDWYCDVCGDRGRLTAGQTEAECVNGHTINVDDDGVSTTRDVNEV